MDILEKSRLSHFQFRRPLIKREAPICKDGSVLGATIETAAGIKTMQADLLSLENNHIMDYGEERE